LAYDAERTKSAAGARAAVVIYGYARVSTDGQSVAAQVAALTGAGAEKIFREVASCCFPVGVAKARVD